MADLVRCKPCRNKTYPLRKQLLLTFLTFAAVSLLLALAVVMGTTAFIGDTAESAARSNLEEQIKRHLTDASAEAAATIGERFRKIQYGVLDVSAYALRDALQEDLILGGGGAGYPLSPAHTDLRDTEIIASPDANLEFFPRQGSSVDLSRSVWYYADSVDFSIPVPPTEQATIDKTARLDLLWPTMYMNSNETKGVYMGVPLSLETQMFRYFPGTALSAQEGSLYTCEFRNGSVAPCFNPASRPWYKLAVATARVGDEPLGPAIMTDPYNGAIDNEWMVTLARAVYSDTGVRLGVVGTDVRLQQVTETVEAINFLDNGFSILATAGDGTVLAANQAVWDRETAAKSMTVCALTTIDVCSGESGWEGLLADTQNGGAKIFKSLSGEESILVAAPVTATFETTPSVSGGGGTVTHYILSAVPTSEIFRPVEGMADLISDSTVQIFVGTAIAALCTLLAVAAAVALMSGSITRPIVKMTAAARSIAKDGAKTNVFGSVLADWGVKGGSQAGRATGRNRALDYLLCRGDDEISTLAREFSLMITGLGRRGQAAEAQGLGESWAFPTNPFTTDFARPPPTAPSAPSAAATAATAPVSTAP